MAISLDIGFDRYDRNARLKPALVVLLPPLLLVAVWLPGVWNDAVALVGVVVFCGLLLLVSRIARHRGRQVQEKISSLLGGLPTTIALRHRDTRIDPQTKSRYHSFLRANGCGVPTSDEEALNPSAADLDYRSCVSLLLERTRDKSAFKMIADENIDFGFRRNLLGLREIGLVIVGLCLVADVIAVSTTLADGINWAGIVLGFLFALLAAAWAFLVNQRFVIDAAWSYAIRLLAACDAL